MRMNSTKYNSRKILAYLLPAVLGFCSVGAQTISVNQIKTIRGLHVLTDQQLAAINTFVNEHFNLLMSVKDGGKELSDRAEILMDNARGTAVVGDQTQDPYAQQFNKAVKENAPRVFEYTETMENKGLAQQIRLATVVIMSRTDNPELIGNLLPLLKDKSALVRYWAAKGLTTANVRKMLASPESSADAWPKIISGLTACVATETSPVVIEQIANAASISTNPGCIALAKQCIDKRLPLYQNWTVDQEETDLELIKIAADMAMSDSLQSDKAAQTTLIKSAAELFTAAYYRYAKGIQHPVEGGKTVSLLTGESQQALESILIDGEIALTRAAAKADPTIKPRPSFFLKILQSPTLNLDRAYEPFFRDLNRAYQLFPEQTGPNPQYFAPLPDPPDALIQGALAKRAIEGKIIRADSATGSAGRAETPGP
jgi:hypothetical protein